MVNKELMGRVTSRASGSVRAPRLLVRASIVVVFGLSMTSCVWSKKPFVPETRTTSAPVERTLARLEGLINTGDADGACALYVLPSERCSAIWRRRIGSLQ